MEVQKVTDAKPVTGLEKENKTIAKEINRFATYKKTLQMEGLLFITAFTDRRFIK